MKRVLGILALAGIVGGTIALLQVRTEAMPQTPSTVVRLVCDGNNGCCNGTGPTNYFYHVNFPSGGAVQVDRIDIGTHDPRTAHYSNFIMPPGWTVSIVPVNPDNWPDKDGCTLHGVTVNPNFFCSKIIRFTGPAQTSSFTLGFDNDREAHQATWRCNITGNKANWAKPVGLGEGPVHSPKNEPTTTTTTTDPKK
jgi:hypothetical protein